jgi:hypothetical protein
MFAILRNCAQRDVTFGVIRKDACTLVQLIVNAKSCANLGDPYGCSTHCISADLRKNRGAAYVNTETCCRA